MQTIVGKILIFGNGGSAAIASHFSVDMTKNARVRCVNYNESDLLTCFSNDFDTRDGLKNVLSIMEIKMTSLYLFQQEAIHKIC